MGEFLKKLKSFKKWAYILCNKKNFVKGLNEGIFEFTLRRITFTKIVGQFKQK